MAWSRDELIAAVDGYAKELEASGLPRHYEQLASREAGRFVAWLRPRDGPADTVASAPRAPSSGGPSANALCEELRYLVDACIAAGKPRQPPIDWRRDHWVAAFPEHTDFLLGLPDRVDRASVAAVCTHASESDEAPVRAFIATMTWGFGTVGYGPHRTRRILEATPDAARRLRELARVVTDSGPDNAYRRMCRDEDLRLKFLGPSFGTKYLHFCQPAEKRPRALILDAFVAGWLRDHCGVVLDPVPFDPPTWRRYLRLMHEWAQALGIDPEELEYCIFRAAAEERGSQWGKDQ